MAELIKEILIKFVQVKKSRMKESEENFILRRAEISDQEKIWEILEQAVQRRKNDGSNQWQDGYPNSETAIIDIQNKVGFVFEKDNEI